MKNPLRLFFVLLLTPLSAAPLAPIPPAAVVIVYNQEVAESGQLAEAYAEARGIPLENLLAIKTANTDAISRADFNDTIRDPLAAEFLRRGWLKRQRTSEGTFTVTESSIKLLVCMRGVPFKIPTGQAREPDENGEGSTPARWHLRQDDASVDTELCLLGNTAYPLAGPLDNPYFRSKSAFVESGEDGMILVGRIDGPTWPDCFRLIEEAVVVEKTGLWGMHYLDLAKRVEGGYKLGDDWLETIARTNRTAGLPTVVDRHRDTLVTNYPMTGAASYFGWYTTHRNGPFLHPNFRFRPGAIAVHLHSFSATDLRNPNKHWTGPLLAAGAAGTVGNVWEPFLQLTHHLDLFHERLLEGFTLVEAAYMANPALSWQGVVVGDPLYRPYAQLDQEPEVTEADAAFLFLREAYQAWPDDSEARTTKIRTEAAKTSSGLLYEALGLALRQEGESSSATAFFNSAAKNYSGVPDTLRQSLHLIDMAREAGRMQDAITRIRKDLNTYKIEPEGKALAALLTILDPPAPPQVDPTAKTE